MNLTPFWSFAHLVLAAVWVMSTAAAFLATRRIKDSRLSYEARARYLRHARLLQIVPRVCFALTLPVGVELVAIAQVYPVNPVLRATAWLVAGGWGILLAVMAAKDGTPAAKYMGYVEDGFAVLAGMAFTVYGLNSLAVGAPIDDPRFAAKLFFIGVAFWTLVVIDLNFRAQAWPFEDIYQEGSTPEREEAMSRAVNFTLTAMAVFFAVLVAVAALGPPNFIEF